MLKTLLVVVCYQEDYFSKFIWPNFWNQQIERRILISVQWQCDPLDSFSSLPSRSLVITLDDGITSFKRLNNCSPGVDGLPPWLFRDYCSWPTRPAQHIFNLSVSNVVVPDCFKKAFVVPIPKVKNPSCEEFRPISMLPVLSKVLEKIILRKWLLPLVPKINKDHFTFVPRDGQGTTLALTHIMNKILSFTDTPGAVRLVMIDFSKAFDKLTHNTILNALTKIKAPKELFMWISSFLRHRQQCIKISDIYSEWYLATSGVPQGGVLSPILFALAVNDLNVKSSNSTLVKYTDDICLLHFMRSSEDDNLQEEFNNIVSWSTDHGLQINSKKTKLLNFQTKKEISPPLWSFSNCLHM